MRGPRRLLVLVGTDHHPFGRALAWADSHQRAFPEDDVLVQHGLSDPPRYARGIAFLTPAEMRQQVTAADVVITHGGPGTISDARSGGHRPIVFPRDPVAGEHVDDHQQRFAPWCAERGLVLLARTPEELTAVVADLPTGGTRLAETGLGSGAAAVTAFAELVARPGFGPGGPVAHQAPPVLYLLGDPGRVTAAEARLATRPGTMVLGAVVADWPRAVSGGATCGCGQEFAACEWWLEVGERALGGWGPSAASRATELARAVTEGGRAGRRHPGRPAREHLLRFCGLHRAVLAAARDVADADLVVVRGDLKVALALSHDRHLDLRVADLGAGPRARWAVGHRRIPLARWPGLSSAGWGRAQSRLLDAWVGPARGCTGHPALAALSPRSG